MDVKAILNNVNSTRSFMVELSAIELFVISESVDILRSAAEKQDNVVFKEVVLSVIDNINKKIPRNGV